MLEEAVDGIEQKIARDHLRCCAKEEKRHGVETKMQRLLNWMEAPDVERVEDFWRMVHLMQAPQLRVMMAGAMQPVPQEVDDQHHRHDLRRQRPVLGPQRIVCVSIGPSGYQ